MRQLAVIGYPIKHSISPVMQQAAFDSEGIEATYVRVEVAPEDLPDFVEEMRAGEWSGINVTVPHKQQIIPLLDGFATEASTIGAVNTVVVSGDRLIGHNTDAEGFLRALRDDGGYDPSGREAAVLGAGGAARAVVWSLMKGGARTVRIVNRGLDRAVELEERANRWGGSTLVLADRWDPETLGEQLAGCSLVVNATPVGLRGAEVPVPIELIPEGALVMDLIYNPRPTRFLREAADRGCNVLDGLPMLVYQGAAAFELWTGLKAPVGVMWRAAEAALIQEG